MGKKISNKKVEKAITEAVDDAIDKIDVDKALYKVTKHIMNDMRRVIHNSLDEFYDDYEPKYYKRTNDLKEHMIGAFSYQIKDKKNISLTITFSPELMDRFKDAKTKLEKRRAEMVFAGPFIQGYHGGPHPGTNEFGEHGWQPAPQMIPSPWEMITQYAQKIYDAKIINPSI